MSREESTGLDPRGRTREAHQGEVILTEDPPLLTWQRSWGAGVQEAGQIDRVGGSH